jgi:hypothetical protein
MNIIRTVAQFGRLNYYNSCALFLSCLDAQIGRLYNG